MASAQEVVIDPNGNVGFAPTLKKSTRPQVVDIAKPGSGGVSHNQYTRFDVTSQGVVLNNSTGSVTTQLQGTIAGNANLAGTPATTIVNEVRNTTATTSLVGPVEVAGTKAHVVIANPNGLTCSGCSFINAGEATLSTGVPGVSGSTVTLNVTKGTVTVGRNGLDGAARGVDTVNLVGRFVVVDGRVTARDLVNVQSGALSYSSASRASTGALTGAGTTRDYGVDATSFGAMEAGRITIVGNETGFGVRAQGALSASASNIAVSSPSDIIVRSATATGGVSVNASSGSATVERDVVSTNAAVSVTGRTGVTLFDTAGVYGRTGVTFSSSHGAVDIKGNIQSDSFLTATATNQTLSFGGYGYALGNATLTGKAGLSVEGATIIADRLTGSSTNGETKLAFSALFTGNDVGVTTSGFMLGQDVVVEPLASGSSKLVVAATGTFRNAGDLRLMPTAQISFGSSFVNEATGVIGADRLSALANKTVTNRGVMTSDGSFSLSMTSFTNEATGIVLGSGITLTSAGILLNDGLISASADARLTATTTLTQNGAIQGNGVYLTGATVVAKGASDIRGTATVQVSASSAFTQQGTIATPGTVTVTAPTFTNTGSITSQSTLTATVSGTILNEGALVSSTQLTLNGTGAITNRGVLASYRHATLTSSGTIDNSGTMQVDQTLTVNGPRFQNSGLNALVRAKKGQINTDVITNSGSVYLIDTLTRSNVDLFDNNGIFATQGSVTMTGRDSASRFVNGADGVVLAGLNPDTATQTLTAGRGVVMTFAGMTLGGKVAGSGNITLSGPASLTLTGLVQSTTGTVRLDAPTLRITSTGKLVTGGIAELGATTSFRNDGQITAGNRLQLLANFVSIDNRGGIYTGTGNTNIAMSGAFTSPGAFVTDGTLTISAGSISSTGALQSGGALSLTSQAGLSLGGSAVTNSSITLNGTSIGISNDTQVSATQLNLTGTSFSNGGDVALTGTSNNTWTLSGGLTQSGLTYAAGDIRITAASAGINAGSLLSSNKAVISTTTGNTSVNGRVSGATVTLASSTFTASADSVMTATGNITVTGSAKTQLLGEASAASQLIVTGPEIITNGRAFANIVTLNATGTSVQTKGSLFAYDRIAITAASSLTNTGLIEAQNKVTVNAASISNSTPGQITTTEMILTASDGVTNTGGLYGAKDITVTADSLNNASGATIEAGSLGFTLAGSFTNTGSIDVFGLFGKAGGSATINGLIDAETYFGLDAASLTMGTSGTNIGQIKSKGHVYAGVTGAMSLGVSNVIDSKGVDLRVGSLSSAGTLRATDIMAVTSATGNIANTGAIYGKTIALSSAKDVTNTGTIGAVGVSGQSTTTLAQIRGGTVSTNTTAVVTNSGTIRADDISIQTQGTVSNNAGATIHATKTAEVNSTKAGIVNVGMLRGKDVDVLGKTDFDNQGTTLATATVRAQAGTIRNRVINGSAAKIQGDVISLDADAGWMANDGTIAGTTATGIRARNGSITLSAGSVTGRDISLIAAGGGVWVPINLSAANSIYAEGETVAMRGTTTGTNAVTLVSTAYNVIVDKTITTKKLIIEAANDLETKAGLIRGTELVQVRASDITRPDTTATNRKLSVISGTLKDVVVEIRNGDFGTYTEADNSGYELANLTASGSISLAATGGKAYLRGTINAANDVVILSSGELFLRSATITSGKVLHLESNNRVKPQGSVTLNPGDALEIMQGSGWFYTSEWLTTQNINYNLVAFAKRIVVDTDQRFTGHDVTFRATENIVQRDHVISARKILYAAANDILIEWDGFDWRDANPGVANTGDYWNVADAGIRGHTLLAQAAGMTLYAGNDIHLISGKIHTGGDLALVAGGNILSEPFYLESYEDSRPGGIGWSFDSKYKAVLSGHNINNVQLTELRAYENILSATGSVSIMATGNIDLIGTQVTATNGGITIHSAQGTITMAAAPGFWMYNHQTTTTKKSWFGLKKTTITTTYDAYDDLYKPTTIKAQNGQVYIASAAAPSGDYNRIISAGTQIVAKSMLLSTLNGGAGGGSITLGTYAAESRVSTTTKSKSTFIGITYRNRTNSTAKTATFNSGNDLLADDTLTITSGKNLTIQDGNLAAKTITLSALGNLNILASINSEKSQSYTNKQNLVTITTIQEGYDRQTASLPQITSPNPVVFSIGGSAHIAAAPAVSLNSQLLTIIGSRTFGTTLDPLHTTAARTAAAATAATVTTDYTRAYALPGATNGAQYAYLDQLMDDYNATYSTIMLRDHSWYDKQVRLTPAFQALLSIAVSAVTGPAGLGLSGWQAAAANALISGGIEGAITGNLDPSQVLRNAVLAGGSAYISGVITTNFQLGTALGLSDASPFASGLGAQFSPQAVVNRLSDQIVNRMVTNVVYGQPVFSGFDTLGRTFLVTEAMGVVQFGIGNLGTGTASWEGSLPHILLHGGVGCVAILALNGNCASGFFAGASQAVLAGSGLSNEQKAALAPLIGGLAGFLWADGLAIGVSFGSTIATSGLANNYLHHAEARRKAEIVAALQVCQSQSNCTNAQINALQRELDEIETLDRVRDAAAMAACRNQISQACFEAIRDVSAAVDSYLGTSDGFNQLWADNQRAGLLRGTIMSGPAWNPEAFGLGMVAGALAVTNVMAFNATIRYAAQICAREPICTAAVAGEMLGTEVLAEFSGTNVVVSSGTKRLGTVDLTVQPITLTRVTPPQSERDTVAMLGGLSDDLRIQVSYFNGREVRYGYPGSVRPDIVVCNDIACEVKNYDLSNGYSNLVRNVAGQAAQREVHLPAGMVQQVYIDIRGQTVTASTQAAIRVSIETQTNGVIPASSVFFIQ
ncbi:beta strand repeat-containing protein [Primorskyibacter flagellatus]|nr:filamentous hemagglutinin N-terminal domain-containing protein [Primorskyibacter flagellatus]